VHVCACVFVYMSACVSVCRCCWCEIGGVIVCRCCWCEIGYVWKMASSSSCSCLSWVRSWPVCVPIRVCMLVGVRLRTRKHTYMWKFLCLLICMQEDLSSEARYTTNTHPQPPPLPHTRFDTQIWEVHKHIHPRTHMPQYTDTNTHTNLGSTRATARCQSQP
jgi:hypothetical protein